jgi:hypothetical protein
MFYALTVRPHLSIVCIDAHLGLTHNVATIKHCSDGEFEMDGRTSADGRGGGWGITRLGVEGGEDGGRGHGLTCGCPLPLNR